MPREPHSSRVRAALIACFVATASAPAAASCGSAYCTLMTDRYAQGTGEPQLGWSGQIRFEELTHDRLRSGTRNVDAADLTGEDTIEPRTRNLNVSPTSATA